MYFLWHIKRSRGRNIECLLDRFLRVSYGTLLLRKPVELYLEKELKYLYHTKLINCYLLLHPVKMIKGVCKQHTGEEPEMSGVRIPSWDVGPCGHFPGGHTSEAPRAQCKAFLLLFLNLPFMFSCPSWINPKIWKKGREAALLLRLEEVTILIIYGLFPELQERVCETPTAEFFLGRLTYLNVCSWGFAAL